MLEETVSTKENHRDYRLNGPTAKSNRTVKTVGQTTIRFTVVITDELLQSPIDAQIN